jgi:hypothetical protein
MCTHRTHRNRPRAREVALGWRILEYYAKSELHPRPQGCGHFQGPPALSNYPKVKTLGSNFFIGC